jgi:hypothetical protein
MIINDINPKTNPSIEYKSFLFSSILSP